MIATPQRTLADKIDRVGVLEAELAPVKQQLKELSTLRAEIAAAWEGPAEAAGRLEGHLYFSILTPRRMQRKIKSMRSLFRAIGQKLFLDNCSFTLEKFDSLVSAGQQAALLSEARTGARDVETFRLPIAA